MAELLEKARDILTDSIRAMVLGAGFVRARFLTPFDPQAYTAAPIPEQYRNGAPSLLITALAYGNRRQTETPPGTGAIAPFAQRNYYREAVKRLQGLAKELRFRYGGRKSDFRILCNSPVPEKPLAAACGLGALGRNSLIITPEAGSLIIIAAMTLPFTLQGDRPEADILFPYCKNCDPLCPPCAAACPTGAARGDGAIDLSRCIQWYASGKGEQVPQEIVRSWGNRLYGCTGCQNGCVHNRRTIQGVFTEEGSLPAYMDPQELLTMSDEEIRGRFKGTSMGLLWLGPKGIRRNARLILRQYER